MKTRKLSALVVIAALLAPAPAAVAAETGARDAAKAPARIASAKALPAPAAARTAPTGSVPGVIGEMPCAPAERMADCIAEYYASGKLRVY